MADAQRTVWLILFFIFLPMRAPAQTFTSDSPISGDSVQVTVTVGDVELDGVPGAEVTVSIPAGQGDLLGFFGNLSEELLLGDVGVDDPDGVVTHVALKANAVKHAGPGNNVLPVRGWDLGLSFGDPGMAAGALETVRFTLLGVTSEQLTSTRTEDWTFGVRVQSTLGTEGSAKIGLADPDPAVEPLPTVSIDFPTQPGPGVPVQVTPGSPFFVEGTASGALMVALTVLDEDGDVVSVSFASVDATTQAFFQILSGLSAGLYTLIATVENEAGTAMDALLIEAVESPGEPG